MSARGNGIGVRDYLFTGLNRAIECAKTEPEK
jgi:hypothetical protein